MGTVKKTAAKKPASSKAVIATVEFEFERSTKNTHRFAEIAAEGQAVIGTLYVQQSAFKGEVPETITVVIN